MKKLALIGLIVMTLGLTACNPSGEPLKLTIEKYKVVDIPDALYEGCPDIRKERMPYFKTLTDVQLAAYITKLYKTNVQCRNVMDKIKDFLKNAKTDLEGKVY